MEKVKPQPIGAVAWAILADDKVEVLGAVPEGTPVSDLEIPKRLLLRAKGFAVGSLKDLAGWLA